MNWRKTLRRSLKEVFSTAPREGDVETATPAQDGFQRFMDECRLEKMGKASGLQMKLKNTIVEPWPIRLKKNATQDEFDVLLASSHVGSERYVEWKGIT